MVAIGSGIASQLIYKPEATYGVAPSLSTNEGLEFKSETFQLNKTTVQGQGLHAGGLFDRSARRVLTNYDVNGGFTIDLPTRFIGNLLQHMTGSFGQTLATPTQISTSGVYKSVHQPGTVLGHSLCFQKGVPSVDVASVVEPFTYVGCKISDWELSVATGALAELSITIDGRNELAGAGNGDPLNGSVPTLGTFSTLGDATQELSSFHFRQATLSTGTPTTTAGLITLGSKVTLGNVTTADFKETKSLDTGRYFLGTSGYKAEQIENGFRQIGGSFTVEWLSAETMYNAFAADTPLALELDFVGPIIGATGTNTSLFSLIVPNIKLDGESPKVGGPAIVSQSISYTALDDEINAPYQIVYQSEDVAL